MDPSNYDCFYILGLSDTATKEESNRAYRHLALKIHPDRNPSQEARFGLVQEAHDYMKEPEQFDFYKVFLKNFQGAIRITEEGLSPRLYSTRRSLLDLYNQETRKLETYKFRSNELDRIDQKELEGIAPTEDEIRLKTVGPGEMPGISANTKFYIYMIEQLEALSFFPEYQTLVEEFCKTVEEPSSEAFTTIIKACKYLRLRLRPAVPNQARTETIKFIEGYSLEREGRPAVDNTQTIETAKNIIDGRMPALPNNTIRILAKLTLERPFTTKLMLELYKKMAQHHLDSISRFTAARKKERFLAIAKQAISDGLRLIEEDENKTWVSSLVSEHEELNMLEARRKRLDPEETMRQRREQEEAQRLGEELIQKQEEIIRQREEAEAFAKEFAAAL